MKTTTRFAFMFLFSGLLAGLSAGLSAADATAQNAVGSPSGTITLDGSQLPPAPMPFGGTIQDDALQSTPRWSPRVVSAAGPVNVLLVITYGSGFGVPSTFGGVIPTEALDASTAEGLKAQSLE